MKHLITAILLFVSFQSFGQFSKGDKVLSGTFSVFTQRAPESPNGGLINKHNTFNIDPRFGFLLTENLEVGARVGYSRQASEHTTSYPSTFTWGAREITTGIYARRFFTLSDKFLFTIVGDMNYHFGKNWDENNNIITGEVRDSNERNQGIGIGITPGFMFLPTNNWAFQANVGNLHYSFSTRDDQPANIFQSNLGHLNFGVAYIFRNKK